MKQFNTFYFEDFEFDIEKLEARFYYSFDEIEKFEEIISFKNDNLNISKNLSTDLINIFLLNLHLSLWISYYKLFPTKDLIIKSWYFTKKQLEFWKNFYLNWLWEFFIKNNINPKNLLNFTIDTKQKKQKILNKNNKLIENNKLNKKSLLLLWWWKDSLVSYNLIKNTDFDFFVFWKLDEIKDEIAKKTWKRILLVKRELSKNLFILNEKWYYNWHIPITWIIAFITIFFSYLYGYKYIILSNEKSADEENIIWNSIKINHQYSKSFEFEQDFSNYIKKYISKNIKYFSILRWFYEYKIAKLFSKQEEFFNIFSSCNKNFKIKNKVKLETKWCCNCEKCSFVFLILSNFIELKELEKIFWENLFDKKSLENTFNDLLWFWKNKPFECVWTYDESIFSFYNAINKYKIKDFYILRKFENIILKNKIDFEKIESKILKTYNENIIPREFKKLLKDI